MEPRSNLKKNYRSVIDSKNADPAIKKIMKTKSQVLINKGPDPLIRKNLGFLLKILKTKCIKSTKIYEIVVTTAPVPLPLEECQARVEGRPQCVGSGSAIFRIGWIRIRPHQTEKK